MAKISAKNHRELQRWEDEQGIIYLLRSDGVVLWKWPGGRWRVHTKLPRAQMVAMGYRWDPGERRWYLGSSPPTRK